MPVEQPFGVDFPVSVPRKPLATSSRLPDERRDALSRSAPWWNANHVGDTVGDAFHRCEQLAADVYAISDNLEVTRMTKQSLPSLPPATVHRAKAVLRFGHRARLTASVRITSGGILSVGALVSGILLSTAVLVRAAARARTSD